MIKFVFGSLLLLGFSLFAQETQDGRVLDSKFHHLGDSIIDYWPEVSKEPEGTRLDLRFQMETTNKETTLSVTYWDINFPTAVVVNGKAIDKLIPSQARKVAYVRIPAGAFKRGENWISIRPSPQDDCVVGNVILHERPFAEVMRVRPITVSVKDDKGSAMPACITVCQTNGALAQIFLAPTNGVAVRTGLMYTFGKPVTVYLPEGDYTIYAMRGMEWSCDKRTVSVTNPKGVQVGFKLRREVDTSGYVAADTHLHTVTFSGHGDATVDERMVTLAGEGVEFAVATDHNHHTDYRPYQEKWKLNKYFTPVTGNEVTTRLGHFNAFPMPVTKSVPDHTQTNWVKLTEDIRMRGAQVIIVNHPRSGRFDIFGPTGFNALTGESSHGLTYPVDGIEVINGAPRNDPMPAFKDWFGLLNHGQRVFAVGSSDSHSVGAPVGQARTYIRSSTDHPGKISVDEMCKNFLAGRSSVALGIYAEVTVNRKFTMGDIAPVKNKSVDVELRVAAPSWVRPQRAIVFVNGVAVAEQNVPQSAGPTKAKLTFTIPVPSHDAHLACIVFGAAIHEPFWRTGEGYTLAATNPVFLDADGDGRYQSPRASAQGILVQTGSNLESQWSAINAADDAVALQLIAVIMRTADAGSRATLTDRLTKAAASRPVFAAYLKSLSGLSAPEAKL